MKLAALLLTAALAAPPAADPPAEPEPPAPVTEKLTIAGETFTLLVAADEPARTRGLTGVETIKAEGGMLFIFPRARPRSFWMKDCLVDMDLLFLDRRGRILAMHEMTVPPPRPRTMSRRDYERRLRRYTSRRPAHYAVELRAGTIRRLKLHRGDTIELDHEKLQRHTQTTRTGETSTDDANTESSKRDETGDR